MQNTTRRDKSLFFFAYIIFNMKARIGRLVLVAISVNSRAVRTSSAEITFTKNLSFAHWSNVVLMMTRTTLALKMAIIPRMTV